MSEEIEAPPGQEDTPNDAPVEGGETTEAPSDNWEERYKEAQAWGTRNAQRLTELEAETQILQALRSDDPEVYNAALQQLGFQAPEEEDPEPDEPYLTREEWQQWQNQMREAEEAERQQQATQQYIEQLDDAVEKQLDELKVQGDETRDWIVSRALALTPSHDLPDMQAAVKAAHQEFEGLIAAQKKSWAGTKQPAHPVSPAGTEGTLVPPRATHEQRVDRAMARLQANQQ